MSSLIKVYTKQNGTFWTVAADMNAAENAVTGSFSGQVPNGGNIYASWDYSMLTPNKDKYYVIDDATTPHEFAISADNYDDLAAQLLAKNGQKVLNWSMLDGDFSLIPPSGGGGGGGGGGTSDNTDYPWGANHHLLAGAIGSPNPDYVGRATNLLNTLLKLGMNANRADIGMSNSGVPNQSAAFTDWIAKCKANNIKMMSVISVSSVASTTVDTSSNAAIHTQRLSMYSAGYAKAAGLMGQTDMATVNKWCNLGSELDVVYTSPYDTFRLKGGNGQVVPAAPTGAGTSASPYVWVDRYNSDGTLAWDMSHHGLLFYFVRGLMEGAKSVTSAVKNGMNHASTHSGRNERLYNDCKNLTLPGCGSGGSTLAARKMDWLGLDWYSREENGSTNGVSNKGQAYNMLKDRFAGLCDQIFFTECGLVNTTNPPAATVSGYSSNGDWLMKIPMGATYRAKSKMAGTFAYEALTEPNRSIGGSDYSERNYGLQKNTDDVNTTPSESILDIGTRSFYPIPD